MLMSLEVILSPLPTIPLPLPPLLLLLLPFVRLLELMSVIIRMTFVRSFDLCNARSKAAKSNAAELSAGWLQAASHRKLRSRIDDVIAPRVKMASQWISGIINRCLFGFSILSSSLSEFQHNN